MGTYGDNIITRTSKSQFACEEWKVRRTPRELEDFFQSIRDSNHRSNIRTKAVYGTMLKRVAGGLFGKTQNMFINKSGYGDGGNRVNKFLQHVADSYEQHLKVVQLLLEHGASIN
jgi:hypothetical protein